MTAEQKSEEKKAVCFVISPIGDPNTDTRKRADQFFNYIVRPVVEPKGFRTIRADKISESGVVTSQIVQHLIEAQLVVADLTDRNPNVMYELAIRHAAQKPLVQLMAEGQSLPFDVGQHRTIFYEIRDLDSVEGCKANLAAAVEAALQQPFIETPVGRMLDIGKFEAETPKDEVLSRLLARLDTIEAKLDRPEARVQDVPDRRHPDTNGHSMFLSTIVQDQIPEYLRNCKDHAASFEDIAKHLRTMTGFEAITPALVMVSTSRSPFLDVADGHVTLKKLTS